ncbi:hypothetical protein LEP1GSC171_2254 [Leptospira santarosai str. HAI1380]|nr:hypothetical protein LEP1GSC040_1925 [Leptospira santarosai str. 2000030832]EMO33227.1 hypothetical protein LEP1GSC175_2097 [Leptospira santarosai str. HAI821]EMP02504.1 hypothetical protein LEP1GSC171_2254 [Leptospira santarosai str. HAI1380]EMP81545.1 hypothetical protein LEP1GSC162_0541 [Leptospira santarosai str. CBC1531]KXZ30105.1 hypothetical protein AYB33_03425 [Leptospira santarosai]
MVIFGFAVSDFVVAIHQNFIVKNSFKPTKRAQRDVICRNSYFPKILLLKPSCVSSHILLFTEK